MAEASPFGVCLQESHLKPGENFQFRGYNSYRYDVIPDGRARGGVITFIKDNISSQQVVLQSNLQAVAVSVKFPFALTICNIYLPDFDWDKEDLHSLIQQLPTPVLLVGDFNAHNPLWGSARTDTRGRLVEQWMEEANLFLLNNGKNTYINSRSHNFSAIDLSFCSPSLAHMLQWDTIEEHATEHIPIHIEFAGLHQSATYTSNWCLRNANWTLYQEKIGQLETPQPELGINEVAEYVSKAIVEAAESSVPQKTVKENTKLVPWWNQEVAQAVKEKKHAFNSFKRNPTQANLITFKRLRAKARAIVLRCKKQTWESFVSNITSPTSATEV